MTSPFENLTGPGKPLRAEPPDAKEFAGLQQLGLARLKDAQTDSLALESRFDLAYNAAHALCLAALSVEAAELLEHFQWLTEEQSRALAAPKKAEVAAEAADVLLYLLQLCDKLQIDLLEAARLKLVVNAGKYPVERARGSSQKYSDITDPKQGG